MPDFLLEIGCEEIPARMIEGAREELGRRVSDLLAREGMIGDAKGTGGGKQILRGVNPPREGDNSASGREEGESREEGKGNSREGAHAVRIETFATPRRLAVVAWGVAAAQADAEEQVTGPAVKAAFKDGQPTVAAQKFAEKVGLPLEKLERVATPKGEYLAARVVRRGRGAAEILGETLPREIAALYWPKSMYWRPGRTSERFVRPVRWLVALLDGEPVPLELFGIAAGKESRGHRRWSAAEADAEKKPLLGSLVSFNVPGEYQDKLRRAGVIASPEEREQAIRKAMDAATRAVLGARWREDAALLNTVVNLTEWPSAVLGSFDREFLSLPEEVLVTVMRDHQKYFAVEDEGGKLAPHFLAVLNTDGDPAGMIRHGHERVLRARFNDARFFWDTDQKIPLRQRVELLKKVTFQKDLGSYFDKTLRVQRLASLISEQVKDAGMRIRPGIVHKAALLAKTDLTTELVKEFTELQGIVGGLYAKAQGLDPAIGDAIYDHYKPESMEDAAPRTIEGAVLSIADKADTIAGMFALGLIPSGSKDPFALRRQANGIVKTLAEKGLALSSSELFADALGGYRGSEAEKKFRELGGYGSQVSAFFRERLEFYLRDVRGFAYDVVNAVLAAGADDVVDAVARAEAVAQVRASEDFEPIAVAFKRLKGILKQAHERKISVGEFVPMFASETEVRIWQTIQEVGKDFHVLRSARKYHDALQIVSKLRPIIDMYFDKVMVMVEDPEVRGNRLALVNNLLSSFSQIADFSEIVTERK